MERIKELLKKLKQAHDIYVVTDERRKKRIFEACGWVIDELVELTSTTNASEDGEALGIPNYIDRIALHTDRKGIPIGRAFFEALLIGGKEFLVSEYGDEEEKIFGEFKRDMTPEELKDSEQMAKIGCIVWERKNGILTPLTFKQGLSMEQFRLRAEYMKKIGQ